MNTFIDCPTDCDAQILLPAIPDNQDCTSYAIEKSQVCDLYLSPPGAPVPFASWFTTPTAVSGAIDNANVDGTKTKWLVGIGGVAAPEKTVQEYPKLKKKTTSRVYTLSYEVLNMSAEQYAFLRKLQCGDTSNKFWYADLAGFVYGDEDGIEMSSVDVDFVKGAGNADVNKATVTITWEADGDPDKKVNPLA